MTFLKKFFWFLPVVIFLEHKIDASALPSREGEASEVQVQVILPELLMAKLEGFEFFIDSYKNIVVTLSSLSSKETDQLKEVISEMANSYKNYGLYVHIPVVCGESAVKLEKLGFRLHDLDTNTKNLSYLYGNGRNIPELNYAYTAAAVYLMRTNPETSEKEVLLINEPQKIIANIIGGISSKGESPEDTVAREVGEEVNLEINKKKLKLVAVFHTVRPDKKSCVEFIYTCDEFKGTPRVDGVEVTECLWVPLSTLLQEEETKIFDKPFHTLWKKVLKGVFKDQKYGFNVAKTKKVYQTFNPIDQQ